MAEALKLRFVYVVDKPIELCTICHKSLAPRKIEVLYHNQNNRSTSKYMLSDIWFCSRCQVGHMLKAFQATTDSSNKPWIVSQQNPPGQKRGGNVARPSTPAPSPAHNKIPVPSSINRISRILADHMTQCVTCSNLLIKHQVGILMITSDGRSSKELQTKAMYCPACHKWMLHASVFTMLQNQNKPYHIDIESQPKPKQPNAKSSKKIQQAARNEQRKASIQTAPAKQKASQRESAYDRFGAFIPTKGSQNRRGYFDE